MDMKGVSISTASRMDMQGVFLSTISSVDVQGVSLSIARTWICRRYPFPQPAVWTCMVNLFSPSVVLTYRVYPFHCETAYFCKGVLVKIAVNKLLQYAYL
jgi:hypothetical protein